jgi:hypothetical protein
MSIERSEPKSARHTTLIRRLSRRGRVLGGGLVVAVLALLTVSTAGAWIVQEQPKWFVLDVLVSLVGYALGLGLRKPVVAGFFTFIGCTALGCMRAAARRGELRIIPDEVPWPLSLDLLAADASVTTAAFVGSVFALSTALVAWCTFACGRTPPWIVGVGSVAAGVGGFLHLSAPRGWLDLHDRTPSLLAAIACFAVLLAGLGASVGAAAAMFVGRESERERAVPQTSEDHALRTLLSQWPVWAERLLSGSSCSLLMLCYYLVIVRPPPGAEWPHPLVIATPLLVGGAIGAWAHPAPSRASTLLRSFLVSVPAFGLLMVHADRWSPGAFTFVLVMVGPLVPLVVAALLARVWLAERSVSGSEVFLAFVGGTLLAAGVFFYALLGAPRYYYSTGGADATGAPLLAHGDRALLCSVMCTIAGALLTLALALLARRWRALARVRAERTGARAHASADRAAGLPRLWPFGDASDLVTVRCGGPFRNTDIDVLRVPRERAFTANDRRGKSLRTTSPPARRTRS